jgi:hypothetical protein
MSEYMKFIEEQVIGCGLDEWLALHSVSDLERWLGQGSHPRSDMGTFSVLCLRHGLHKIGAWPARYLSTGGWRSPGGEALLNSDFHNGEVRAFDPARIVEHAAPWYEPHDGFALCRETDLAPSARRVAGPKLHARRPVGETPTGPYVTIASASCRPVEKLPSAFVRDVYSRSHLGKEIGIWLARWTQNSRSPGDA